MSRKRFNLEIGNTDYSEYITYPVQIPDTSLSEKMSEGEIVLRAMELNEPLKPHRPISFVLYEDDAPVLTKEYILLNDSVNKLGVSNKYDHRLNFIEATYRLEILTLPNLTVTRTIDEYTPTLLDVARRILRVAGVEDEIAIEASTAEILDRVESPEWTFTRMTALEALRLVFNHEVSLIPYMETLNELGHKNITDEETNKTQYITFSSGYDPQSYRTILHSPAANMIGGNDLELLVEPANGWTTLRSDESRITMDNIELHTQFPLYGLRELWINGYIVYSEEREGTIYHAYKSIEEIGYEKVYSFASFINEAQKYQQLPNTNKIEFNGLSKDQKYMNIKLGQGSSLYYERGSNNIGGFSDIAPSKWRWAQNKQSIRELLGVMSGYIDYYNFYQPYKGQAGIYHDDVIGVPVIRPQYLDTVIDELQPLIEAEGEGTVDGKYIGFVAKEKIGDLVPAIGVSYTSDDIRNLQFRTEYYALLNADLKSYRPLHNTDDSEIPSSQYHNQTATVMSADALGEQHRRILERGMGQQQAINDIHKNWNDILPTGARDGDYILGNSNHFIHRNHIVSDYTFNQYKQKLNKYVGVLEEYRQFAIPNENIVERTKNIEMFVKASFNEGTDNTLSNFDTNFYASTAKANLVQITGDTDTHSFLLPGVTYGFGNSAVISTTTQTNNVVGFKSVDEAREPSVYTNDLGRMENLHFRVGSKLDIDWDVEDSNNYPEFTETISNEDSLWSGWSRVDKDAREQLLLTFQLHHISEDSKINFTKYWVKELGIIRGVGMDNFDVVMLAAKPTSNNFEDLNIIQQRPLDYTVYNRRIKIEPSENESPIAAVAWGIVGGGKLLAWVEERVEIYTSPIWLNFETGYVKPQVVANRYRVNLQTNISAPITISTPSLGTITSKYIDLLVPKDENITVSVPEQHDGRTFQLWGTRQGTVASNSNELTITNSNLNYYWTAIYD